jgi:signal transduction histidine kinase
MSSLPNILLVDDNATNLLYLEIILRDIKANLIQSRSGMEALEATQDIDISLAILDVQMPFMNGYELALRLNEKRGDQKIPIIFLTAAYPDNLKILEGYKAGAVDYLIKPLNKEILISKINVFLSLYWQKETLIKNAEKLRASEMELQQAKEQLVQVNQNLIHAIESERSSISLQVHDELGQAMTALKMDMNWVRQNIGNKEAAKLKLGKMIALTNDVIRKVQHISTELHPGLLDDLGLVAAIEWYCEDFEERTGITCILLLDENYPDSASINLTFFRIMQEALTNVIRHAMATEVTIELKEQKFEVILKITDNGKGFDKKNLTNGNSFGIIGMNQRAQQHGGTIEFSGSPNKGTTIIARIPKITSL